jgi:hypothetical protein
MWVYDDNYTQIKISIINIHNNIHDPLKPHTKNKIENPPPKINTPNPPKPQ